MKRRKNKKEREREERSKTYWKAFRDEMKEKKKVLGRHVEGSV